MGTAVITPSVHTIKMLAGTGGSSANGSASGMISMLGDLGLGDGRFVAAAR
jgi:hypothetical protein